MIRTFFSRYLTKSATTLVPHVCWWIRDSIWLSRLFQQPCFFKLDEGRERIRAEITKRFREAIRRRNLLVLFFKNISCLPLRTCFHSLSKRPRWWPAHLLTGSKGCWNTFWKVDWCAWISHWESLRGWQQKSPPCKMNTQPLRAGRWPWVLTPSGYV